MNLVIDNLDTVTGWSASGGATSIHGLNDHLQYVAGENTQSLMFNFDGLSSYVEKTYGTDVSDYEELILHVWSQQKKGGDFKKESDFSYKIDIGDGKEYFLPVWRTFHHVVIDISSITTIDRIRITALHDDEDYLLVSYAVVAKDEFPIDIFTGVQSRLETMRDNLSSFLLGTVSTLVGEETITLPDFNFIDDYAVIRIDDGNNSEIHHLKNKNESVFRFTDLYDGEFILNTFTNASVYLHFPVEFGGRDQIEATIPGIMVWGFEPDPTKTTFEIQDVYDTHTSLGASERKEGVYFRHPVLLDCEARQYEIISHLAKIVRHFIGQRVVYINGRKLLIDFNGAPTLVEPTEHIDIIPKIQYPAVLELREDVWQRTSLVKTETINTSVTITP